jgi:hypothetical protein
MTQEAYTMLRYLLVLVVCGVPLLAYILYIACAMSGICNDEEERSDDYR